MAMVGVIPAFITLGCTGLQALSPAVLLELILFAANGLYRMGVVRWGREGLKCSLQFKILLS